MEQMPDKVPVHQSGHYRGTYSMPPSTQVEKQRSRSRYRVPVIQPGLVSEEGGIACTKPTCRTVISKQVIPPMKVVRRDGHGSKTLLDPPRTRPFFKGLGLNFLDPSDPGPGLDPKKI